MESSVHDDREPTGLAVQEGCTRRDTQAGPWEHLPESAALGGRAGAEKETACVKGQKCKRTHVCVGGGECGWRRCAMFAHEGLGAGTSLPAPTPASRDATVGLTNTLLVKVNPGDNTQSHPESCTCVGSRYPEDAGREALAYYRPNSCLG